MESASQGQFPRYRVPSSADYERVSALFLGPKAENSCFLRSMLDIIVTQQESAREAYFPDDKESL